MKEFMQSLESEEMFYTLSKCDKTTIFVFSANWCPDCLFIRPFMPELIEKYNEMTFVYVDRDQFIDLCVDLNIMGIPSFVAYRNGEEVDRFVSKLRKTKDEIDQFFSKLS